MHGGPTRFAAPFVASRRGKTTTSLMSANTMAVNADIRGIRGIDETGKSFRRSLREDGHG